MNELELNFELKTGLNFQEFYKKTKIKLTWYLSKWTGDLSVAEDFTNDAFIKALNSIDTYNGVKSQVHTWIYTIATNFVIKDYNERKKLPTISMDKDIYNNLTMVNYIPYCDGARNIEKHKEDCKKAQIVKDAIYNLSEKHHKYKTVLIMREIENMSYKEISDTLDLNENTVKSQIKMGRKIIVNKVSKKLDLIDKQGIA